MNFIIFRAVMIHALEGVLSNTQEKETFIIRQWKLLRTGVRDVRIHDAACSAWSACGGRV